MTTFHLLNTHTLDIHRLKQYLVHSDRKMFVQVVKKGSSLCSPGPMFPALYGTGEHRTLLLKKGPMFPAFHLKGPMFPAFHLKGPMVPAFLEKGSYVPHCSP